MGYKNLFVNFSPMNLEFKSLLPQTMAPESRVWIYQSNRNLNGVESQLMKDELTGFNKDWVSHGSKVHSFADLFFNRFIILMADETMVQVGGCSTDSSTNFIKKLESQFNVSLFDRQLLAFLINDKIETVSLDSVNTGVEDGLITADTLYFNNTILTKKDMLNNWIIPVKDSWLAGRLSQFSSPGPEGHH